MILVLDDDPVRHDWFTRSFEDVVHVWTVPEMIAQLELGDEVRVIFLDHDLGTEPAVGRDVARWLIAHPERHPKASIIVHSVNVVSGPKISRELRDAGRVALWRPFPELQEEMGASAWLMSPPHSTLP